MGTAATAITEATWAKDASKAKYLASTRTIVALDFVKRKVFKI